MQMLPSLAKGDANKVWIVPSELNDALKGLGSAVGQVASSIPAMAQGDFTAPPKIDVQDEIRKQNAEEAAASERTMQEAIAAARQLEKTPLDRPAALSTGHGSTENGSTGYGGSAMQPSPAPEPATVAEPAERAPAEFETR
jgi:hypothetical protein